LSRFYNKAWLKRIFKKYGRLDEVWQMEDFVKKAAGNTIKEIQKNLKLKGDCKCSECKRGKNDGERRTSRTDSST